MVAGRLVPPWLVVAVASLGALAVPFIVTMTVYQLTVMTVQGDIESHTSSTWLASMVLVGALSTLAPLAYRAVASNHCLCNPMADVLHRRSG